MKKLILMCCLALMMMAGGSLASVIDAPHNETYGIKCSTCHSYSLWWQYSPTSRNPAPNDHAAIVDAVCMTCHGGSGSQPKAMTHSSTVMNTTLHGTWGVGCMACHNPHVQDQLTWVGTATTPYLVTGTIGGATYDSILDQTAITYANATANLNWPAVGALATDPDWANKSLTNPNRGLILVHDTVVKDNTFLIVSATSTQVVVKGKLDPNAIDPNYVNPATGLKNPATCTSFGLIYGQLIRSTINAKGVKFIDPAGGFVEAGTSTTGICQVCHTPQDATHPTGVIRYGMDGVFPAITDSHAGRETINCTSCHKHAVGFKGAGHDNSSFVWGGNCAICHNAAGTVVSIVNETHLGNCGSCHVDPAGGGLRKDGDPANGIDGSALGAINGSSCVDCHLTKLVLTSGGIHHLSATGYAAAGNCTQCHGNAVGKLAANHSVWAPPAATCDGCHTATGGTLTGMPIDPLDNKVHDACTTCHATDGILLSVAAANDPATPASVIAMVPGDCVGCHGSVSHTSHTHALTVVAAPTCDGCHPATAGTASGMPVDPLNNKVHDACTTCHAANGALHTVTAANDPATAATVIAMAPGDCVGCHGSVSHTTYTHALAVIAAPTCDGCHGATAGTASGMPVDAVNNKVHDACTTCHATNGTLLTVTVANDPATVASVVAMVAGDCVGCHGAVSHTTYTHALTVAASPLCNGCHPATAGTATGMPLDPLNNKVHDACTTCHAGNGALLTVATANDPATAASVIAMVAGDCVGCHGTVTHSNLPHDTRVVASPLCDGCHAATAGTATGMPIDPANNKVHDACTTCHDANGLLKSVAVANDPATPASVIAMALGDCAGCHGAVSHTGQTHALTVVAAPTCDGCHAATAGTASGMPVDPANNKLHDACTTCHATNGALLTVAAANDPATPASVIAMVAGDCVGCHGAVSHTSYTHALAAVAAPTCDGCHPATAGTASGMPVDPLNSKVHDACTTCHATNGALLTVTAANDPATLASVIAMAAGDCVGCHGAVSHTTYTHALAVVAAPTCDGCHTATAGTASGMPVDPLNNKVHDACTTCHATNGLLKTVAAANDPATPASVIAMAAGDCVGCHGPVNHTTYTHVLAVVAAPTCDGCHPATAGSATGMPVDPANNKVHDACTTCHAANGALLTLTAANDPATPASVIAMAAGDCVGCHGAVSHTAYTHALAVVAAPTCDGCHTATAGTATGVPVDPANNKVHDACTTCHAANGLLKSVTAANDLATPALVIAMVPGDCVGCHGAVTHMAYTHALTVVAAPTCAGCHPATAGTDTGVPVDPAANKVHDACTTCHATNGALLTVTAANDPATPASVIAMVVGDCVGCHGPVSHTTYTHTLAVVAASTCDGCHPATAGTATGMPVDPLNNKVHDACITCHDSNGLLKSVAAANDPATPAAVIAMAVGDCVGCHGPVSHTTYTHALNVVASNLCDGCHTATAGTASGMPVDPANNKLHDACTTCHDTNGLLKSVAAANDPATPASVIAMAAGDCVGCHGTVSHTSHTHALTVAAATSCSGCHPATAGTASGMPVDPLNNKVHDACTTCHAGNGALLSVAVANNPATPASVVAMVAGDCVGCHGPVSHTSHTHALTVVASSTCNGCHTATAGTASGMPVDPLNNKVHDACTTCHDGNGLLKSVAVANDPATPATVIAMAAGDCVGCHGPVSHTAYTHALAVVAAPTCDGCHPATAGTASGMPVDPLNNKVHDACTTCHAANGALLSVAAANDPATPASVIAMATGDCAGCHGAVSHTTYTHALTVVAAPTCSGCHPATAGTASGMPVDSLNNKLHDACTTCHATNGLLKSVAVANDPATAAAVIAMAAGDCVGCHGNVTHANLPHDTRVVASSLCDGCHAATAGTATGMPVDPVNNKVHDACTTCHDTNGLLKSVAVANDPATPASVIAMAVGDCVGCHGEVSHTTYTHALTVVAAPTCSGCHPATAGTASGMPVDPLNNKVHDACTTCHASNGALLTVAAASDPATPAAVIAMVAGDCVGCHGNVTHSNLPHDTRVVASPLCDGCHAATAGTATGMPVDPVNNKVHDACTTCHDTNGLLKSVAVANDPATPASVIAMALGDCVGCHGTVSHTTHTHALTVVAASTCDGCHPATAGTASGMPVDPVNNKVHDACTTCHAANGALLTVTAANDPATPAAVIAMIAGDCVGCHGAVSHTTYTHALAVVAAPTCDGCHTATAGTASGMPVDPVNNKVHDACTTCHATNGLLKAVAAANDPATPASVIAMAAGDCVGCHGPVSHTTYTHASRVVASNLCDGCHTATAGTASGMPVDPVNNKVHDACTTCHATNGALLTVAAANDPATPASVIAMAAGDCVGCHGSVSHTSYTHALTVVAATTCDGCHTATAGTASGMPVDPLNNKVHDACTTCHAGNGALLTVAAANNPATSATVIAMAPGDCVGCHGPVSHTTYTHALTVAGAGECTSCHTATAGTASGMPLDSVNNKVHDACTTCHATNGALLSVAAANDPATPATVVAMAAGNCLGCHGATAFGNHSHDHATVVKVNTAITPATANCIGCHTATTAPFVATGQVHAPLSCQSCHSAATGLLTGSAAGKIGGGECTTCHTTYFTGHGQHNSTTHAVLLRATDLSNGAACNTCHRRAGTTSANPLFTNTWSGTDGIYALHQLGCTECHDSTRTTNLKAGYASVQAIIRDNTLTIGCLDCHADRAAGHGGHNATDFVGDAACTTCHNGADIVATVHQNKCGACHVNPAGGGLRRAGTDGSALLGDASALHRLATCLTCHPVATYPTGGIHHDTATAANNSCVTCHAAVNHTTVIANTATCTSCHTGTAGTTGGAPVSLTDSKIHDSCRTCHTFNAQNRGILVNFTNAKGVNGTGSLPDGGTIGGTNGGGACTVCHTVATPSTYHHTSNYRVVGNCEYCHADPRPSWNTTRPGDNVGGVLTGAGTQIPTHLACNECHVRWTGSAGNYTMTVNKFTRTVYTSLATAWTTTAQHSFTGMSSNKINTFGICFSCHDGTKATKVSMWHGRPDRFGGANWALTNNTRFQRCVTEGDEAHYAAGRSSSGIGRFNIFRANYYYPNANNIQPGNNDCSAFYTTYQSAGAGLPANLRITVPTVTQNNGMTGTYNPPVFAKTTQSAGTPPAAADTVQVTSATWNGATTNLVVSATTSNSGGCQTLSVTTQPDGTARGAMSGTGTCTMTVAVAAMPANVDVKTSNTSGVNVLGYRVVATDSIPPADGVLTVTPGAAQNGLSWTPASDAGGLRATNTYDLRFLTGATAPTCTTGTSVYLGTALTYTHTALTNGTQYSYRVCAYDAANNVSTGVTGSGTPNSAPAIGAITATPATATHVPAAFTLSAPVTSTVALTSCEYTTNGTTWTAGTVSGASSPYTCTATLTGQSGALALNMRATNSNGVGTGTAITRNVDATGPTDGALTVSPGNAQNGVSWTAASDAGSGLATANTYDLRFLSGATAPTCTTGTSVYTGTALTFTHAALTNGTQYSYRVCAVDSVGNLSTGATGSATPSATIPVMGAVTATPATTTHVPAAFALSSAVTSSVAPTGCEYTTNGTTWLAATVSGVSSPYTCTANLTGQTGSLLLNVRATTTGGTGTGTEIVRTVDASGPTDGTLTVTSGNGQNGLTWTAASDAASGLAAVNTYDVRYLAGATAPTCSTGTSVYLGTALTYTHTALTNGTQYSYRVCAYDNVTNVSTGASGSGTPTAATPPVIGTVTATPATATYVPASFALTSAVTSTVALTGCEYTSNGTTWTAGTVSGASSPYTCTANLTGQTGALTLNLRATNAGGVGTGTAVSRTVDATAPTTGTLTVTAGSAQNGLTWTASTDAASGLRTANSYDLRFLTGATAPTCTTGTSVYSGTALSFTHTALTNGTQYSYRVCAYDNVNNPSTGATGSGTPVATSTSVTHYLINQASSWGVGADGSITLQTLADTTATGVNVNRAGSQTTATTGTTRYRCSPTASGTGTNVELLRWYTTAYASATTIGANAVYTIDTMMRSAGDSASFLVALYDYNPAGASGNGVQIGSTRTITMANPQVKDTVEHWTGNFGNTAYSLPAGHRLEMRILTTYVSSQPSLLFGQAPNTTGNTTRYGAISMTVLESGGGGADSTPPADGVLTVTPGDAQNGLSWTAATDAGGLRATNTYDVRFLTGATAPTCSTGTSIYSGTALTTTHTALTNGTQYSYRVCAYDAADNVSIGATGNGTPVAGGGGTATTYYFKRSQGVAIATGVSTTSGSCGVDPTSFYVEELSTSSTDLCATDYRDTQTTSGANYSESIFNTGLAASTTVTGQDLRITIRDGDTAGFQLFYVTAAGTKTNIGSEVTQVNADGTADSYLIDLSSQSAVVPAGAKIGIRLRVVSTSNGMRFYIGSEDSRGVGFSSGILRVIR